MGAKLAPRIILRTFYSAPFRGFRLLFQEHALSRSNHKSQTELPLRQHQDYELRAHAYLATRQQTTQNQMMGQKCYLRTRG